MYVIVNPHYLRLDLYLENGANDGQCVANNDEDIPPVQKLELVEPWDFFTAMVPAVECVLLFTTQGNAGKLYCTHQLGKYQDALYYRGPC